MATSVSTSTEKTNNASLNCMYTTSISIYNYISSGLNHYSCPSQAKLASKLKRLKSLVYINEAI